MDEKDFELLRILDETRKLDLLTAMGMPVRNRWDNKLYNCAAVIQKGSILGLVPKTYIPNYGEFYEQRWFASGKGADTLVELAGDRDKAWEVARTIAMKRRKAKLNRRSDREARVLVGARLPRQEAFEIQREAERRGQSLYSFVRETLYREVHWNFK